MKPPRVVNALHRPDRKNGGGPVAHAHSGPSEAKLHDESRVLAGRMTLALLRGRNAERRGVIVGAERCSDEAAASRFHISGKWAAARPIHHGARRLDHDLHAK